MVHVARIFLGIVFLVAGVNGYVVGFGHEPFIATSPAAMAIFQFKYLLVAEKSLEILCGILLLINRFVPLSLVLLSAIVVNIFLLHLFVDPSLLLLAILIVLSYGYLLFSYRKSFTGILQK